MIEVVLKAAWRSASGQAAVEDVTCHRVSSPTPTATRVRKVQTWLSPRRAVASRWDSRMNSRNGIEPRIMNRIAAPSIAALSKKAKLLSWVLKPPVAMVVMAWVTASKGFMPRTKYVAAAMAVRRRRPE